VRAAGFTNLLIAALCLIEFCILAVVFRSGTTLVVGFTLLLLMSLAIWLTAAVLGGVVLVPRWLWSSVRRRVQPARSSPGDGSGVWDEWLDSP
jgi:hypothetical protein